MSSLLEQQATINIGGFSSAVHDDFYRYTMPVVECQAGRRNEIAITNLLEVAKALRRTPEEILKYLSSELGCSGSYSSRIDQYILKGDYSIPEIQRLVNQFGEDFVVCKACRDPGTKHKVSQRKKIVYLKCGACGAGRTGRYGSQGGQIYFEAG